MTSKTRRVVITGIGALTPLGLNANDFWENLCNGKSGAGKITRFDASQFPVQIACEIRDLDLEDFFDRKTIRKNDLLTLYALIASREAILTSQLKREQTDLTRAGVIWASGNGGITTLENELLEYSGGDGKPRFSPFYVPKTLIDTPSGAIALENGFRGINYCPVSACASSTTAIMDAFQYIKWNRADVMITGGSEAPISRAMIGGFGAMKALSTRNMDPVEASRPLDVDRDGFVMSEGSGAIILEEYEHAIRRGAPILAEIVGSGMSNDAFHATATHPEGEGAALAIHQALEEAGVTLEEVQYTNLHATGTRVGDLSEVAALAKLLPEGSRSGMYLSATKASTGHLLGAAGALETVTCIKAILENKVPPTINLDTPDPELIPGFKFSRKTPVKHEIHFALNNNFGFGGHNAVVILRKFSQN